MILSLLCLLLSGCGDKKKGSELTDKLEGINKPTVNQEESAPKEELPPEDDDNDEADTVKPSENNDDTADSPTEEGSQHKSLTEAECKAKIELLRDTEPVLPAETELLAEMASCVTGPRILDEHGMIFSKMDNNKRAALRDQFLEYIMWDETAFTGAIPVESADGRFEADKIISLKDALGFFREVYGEEDFTPAPFEQVQDGYFLLSFGDGDPWEWIEHMQFFEDEDYFLLTGPSFYEDNGGCINFVGYADILFEKNPESRYGVTLLYGRYRNEKINVASVETSSELPEANGKIYWGMNLIDDDPTTVWAEGVPGTGVGETITLHLDKVQPVYGVVICNGYTASYKQYTENGMPAEVSVDFGNGNAVRKELEGYAFEDISPVYLAECNNSKVENDGPVMTDTITITILTAKKGTKYDDSCISGIQVY